MKDKSSQPKQPASVPKTGSHNAPRRRFVKAATATGAGLMFVPAASVFGTPANSSPRLGIIGSGGRGNEVGGQFTTHTDTRVTALADPFDDRLAQTRDHFDKVAEEKGYAKIPSENLFKGLKAYEKLVQSKDVDVVLVTSPPYFHPEHLEAAVAAGKHVYLEKPVATDVHGCNRVVKAGKQANGKVSIHVGFQKRYSEAYRAMMEKIHGGELGDLVLGQSFYYTNDLDRKAKPGMSEMEARIRNWVFDKVLSGDILVEQNIHIIDAVNWAFKSHPIRAMGSGGRIVRKDVGDVWDHFIMTFVYPGEVKVSFNSNQFKNKGYRDQGERFFGTKGVAESHQGGQVFINFNDGTKWDSGTTSALATSVGNKVKAFIEGIKSGKFENQTEQGADSTLSVILGRTAAYSGREMTWERLVKSDAKWDAKLNGDLA
ncbi:MAG TPA: Gfo/Idh/MocA family oxidoreductase [Blastocatellia bacterium]|nr:Gfo/Idh/MocA family oxidoreductase [Blastocatellia bacterium]